MKAKGAGSNGVTYGMLETQYSRRVMTESLIAVRPAVPWSSWRKIAQRGR